MKVAENPANQVYKQTSPDVPIDREWGSIQLESLSPKGLERLNGCNTSFSVSCPIFFFSTFYCSLWRK